MSSMFKLDWGIFSGDTLGFHNGIWRWLIFLHDLTILWQYDGYEDCIGLLWYIMLIFSIDWLVIGGTSEIFTTCDYNGAPKRDGLGASESGVDIMPCVTFALLVKQIPTFLVKQRGVARKKFNSGSINDVDYCYYFVLDFRRIPNHFGIETHVPMDVPWHRNRTPQFLGRTWVTSFLDSLKIFLGDSWVDLNQGSFFILFPFFQGGLPLNSEKFYVESSSNRLKILNMCATDLF